MKRFTLPGIMLGLVIAVGAIIAGSPVRSIAQAVPAPFQTGTFTSATSSPVILSLTGGQNSAWFHQVGTPGPVDVSISNDGTHWTPTGIYALVSGTLTLQAQPFTGTTGVDYLIWPIGTQEVRAAPDGTWSGQSSAVLLRASASIAMVPGGGGGGGSGPCPTAGANVTITGTAMPGCSIAAVTPTPLPSPTAVNTTGASSSCVWVGLVETCTFQTPSAGSGTCSPTATPPAYECTTAYNGAATTPSPQQSGFIAAQAAFLGPRPSPSATANFLGYAAGTDSAGTYGCSGSSPAGYMAIGTSAHETSAQVNGVNGGALTLWCFNTSDNPPYMAISLGGADSYPGGRCCVASLENYYAQGFDIDYPAGFAGIDGMYWESNNPYGCGFTQHSSSASYTTYYDSYPATPSPDLCSLTVNKINLPSVGASSVVCTDSSSNASPCPSPGFAIPCPTAGSNVTITGTVMPACTINSSGGGGGGGSVTYGTGVPNTTPSPAQPGQEYIATDTAFTGMKHFSYNGQYTGLPYIVNRCIRYNTSTSGTPSMTCDRTITSGDLLVTMLLGWGGGYTGASVPSGWTSLYNDTGGEVGLFGDWQIATSNASPAPATYTMAVNQLAVTLEIANSNTPSPMATVMQVTGNPAATAVTSVASNSLILASQGCYQSAVGWSQSNTGGAFLVAGITGTNSSNSGGVFWAFPFITPYTYGSTTYASSSGCNGGVALIVVAGFSGGTANFWDVVGLAERRKLGNGYGYGR